MLKTLIRHHLLFKLYTPCSVHGVFIDNNINLYAHLRYPCFHFTRVQTVKCLCA